MATAHPPHPSSLTIPESQWRALRLAFLLLALAALASATAGLWRAAGDLGRPFGGFAWTLGHRDLYWVYPTTPHHWPAIESGMRVLDVILSADGRPPALMAQVFSAHAGQEIAYELERAGQQIIVVAPVVAFSPEMYWELYGAFALSGVSALLSAQVLLRRTRERPFVLLACFLLICGAMLVNQVNGPRTSGPYATSMVANLISTFGYPSAGAVMWHFTLVFPRQRPVLWRHPWLLRGIYLLAVALGAVRSLSVPPIELTRAAEPVFFPAVLGFALSGLVASLVGGALAYRSAMLAQDTVASYLVRRLAVAWVTGVVLYSYIGVGLDLATNVSPLVGEMVFSMSIIYPVLLVYALFNVQTVEQLRRHLSVAQAMRRELSELRRARENSLHEIADNLHDYVLNDIRGLQMSAEAAAHHGQTLDSQYASQTLDGVYRVARRIMEGAKPADLAEEQLLPSVQRILDGLTTSVPDLDAQLQTSEWDENFSLALKEEMFRILRSAVTNVRDHAHARHLIVTLSKDGDCLYGSVVDDGHGFDVSQGLRPVANDRRRHLGLRAMRAHAEKLGGQLFVKSGPAGTEVSVTLPLVMPTSETDPYQ